MMYTGTASPWSLICPSYLLRLDSLGLVLSGAEATAAGKMLSPIEDMAGGWNLFDDGEQQHKCKQYLSSTERKLARLVPIVEEACAS